MTACSPILTPSNTISTYSGNVAQLLAQVEARPQDFCLTTSWASRSSTPPDGIYLTGVSLIRKEQSCQISTSTLHRVKDHQFLEQSEKSEESLVSFRWPLSGLKELNLQSSPRVVDIVVKNGQMELM